MKIRDRIKRLMLLAIIGLWPVLGFGQETGPAATDPALAADWLYQVGNHPKSRDLENELVWARQIAARIQAKKPGIDLAAELAQLNELEKRLRAANLLGTAEKPVADATVLNDLFGTSIHENVEVAIPVANGTYKLQLLLYEGWGDNGRKADILVEGTTIASGCNYWEQQGKTADTGSIVTTGVEIKDGVLNIAFKQLGPHAPHLSGLVLAPATAPVPTSIRAFTKLENLDLAKVSKAINFGVTKDVVFGGVTFKAAGKKTTVDGVTNTASGEVYLRYSEQTVPNLADATAKTSPALIDGYLEIRRIKRNLLFKDPAIDFSQLLFVETPYPDGQEWCHETSYRDVARVRHGGRLLVLDGLSPSGKLRQLAPADQPAAFLRPDLSFDGKRVLFCMKPQDQKAFHLYEMNLDGSGLRQITDGHYSDVDPLYLPDGNLFFLSTRANVYIQCGPWAPAPVITRCDRDGRNLYILSPASEAEFSPALLDDGRVLYTRWEYVDKFANRIQSLWTTRPDGTAQTVYWGNQSVVPDHLGEARQIPGTQKVMFNGIGHHDVFQGSIGIIDNVKGLNYPLGITRVTMDVLWGETGANAQTKADVAASPRHHAAGKFSAYKSPYPLSEDLFIVSARKGGPLPSWTNARYSSPWAEPFKQIYLMDLDGNKELIYQGQLNAIYAQPVKARPRPPVFPAMADFPGAEKDQPAVRPGTLLSANVFEGVDEAVRQQAKRLRVIELLPKYYSTGIVTAGGGAWGTNDHSAWGGKGQAPWMFEGKVFGDSTCYSGPVTTAHGPLTIKQILGTVPIAEDGSVHFTVPPGKALYFQLLDSSGRTLVTMRSWTTTRPGETRTCVGCHKLANQAPVPIKGLAGKAVTAPPAQIMPPSFGVKSLSYVRDIQPLLDRNCGNCHQGNGEGKKALDLTLRPLPDGAGTLGGVFPEPYFTLVFRGHHVGNYNPCPTAMGSHAPEANYDPQYMNQARKLEETLTAVPILLDTHYESLEPLTALSYKSKLVDFAMSGKHHNVKMNDADLSLLIGWIDTWAMFRSEQDIRELEDPDPKFFSRWSSPPRLKTAPASVKIEYSQDEYSSQEDRLPHDPAGKILPPVTWENGIRQENQKNARH